MGWEKIEIGSNKRVRAKEIDMIRNYHNIGQLPFLLETSSSVGQNKRLDSELGQHTNWICCFGHRHTFIKMNTTLKTDYRNSSIASNNKITRMTHDAACWKMRNVSIRNGNRFWCWIKIICQFIRTCSKLKTNNCRKVWYFSLDKGNTFFEVG